MKTMILSLFLLILTSFNQAQAQTSYEESKTFVAMSFNATFSKDYEDAYVIVMALEDYGVSTKMSRRADKFESNKKLAFEEVDCEECKLLKAFATDDPMKYVFDEIEESDIFIITHKNDQFWLEHYGLE